MSERYVLNSDGNPVAEPNLEKWAQWLALGSHRRVAEDFVGKSRVSTVFLGLNHQFGDGPPLLWETMVFGGPLDREQERCSGNREQAEAMHAAMVARVKEASP